MKKSYSLSILLPFLSAAAIAVAQPATGALVLTSSNATKNQLLVYNAGGVLIQTVDAGGAGGVSGNAGGLAIQDKLAALVNYGSQSVAVFHRGNDRFTLNQVISTVSAPVSVAFGRNHLYILGTTKVESHEIFGDHVSTTPDGVASLVVGDGSSAQVGVLPNQLIVTEKSNMIETVGLLAGGAVAGIANPVQGIPANVNAPFGLITRGDDAYVTIAHANETSLVRNGKVLTTTGSGSQMAPCWLGLEGPFLFSSNSPSKSVSRYAVYGQKIVLDNEVVAHTNGSPTDIAAGEGLVAVVDGASPVSHLSIFSVDEDGNLTLRNSVTLNGAINGIAIVP